MSAVAGPRYVADVRAFNRFYTSVMGFLDQGLLQSKFTLTEARLVFELAQQDAREVAELRSRMRIDRGHLSRILGRFESSGIVTRTRSDVDGRRQLVALTPKGRQAFETLDARSDEQAGKLLSELSADEQRRLVGALKSVTKLLDYAPPARAIVLRPMRPGDLGWVVQRHGVVYTEEYGWDQTFEGLVASIVGQYGNHHDPASECGWIAEVDDQPVGSVFCMRKDPRTAQLRLLLVEPSARGLGVGSRLVDECVSFARSVGYEVVSLWTNDVLAAARHIYQRAGFQLVEEDRHHSFGKDLVGQHWTLKLRG